MAHDETPCVLIKIILSHYPVLICSIGNVNLLLPYDHGKSALDETSYPLSLSIF